MTNTRNIKYDYIRVVAMLFVIGIHAWGSIVEFAPNQGNDLADVMMLRLLNISVPIFFALSGAVSLNKNYSDYIFYYKKRFIAIIIPMLIYATLYVFYADWESNSLSVKTIGNYFYKIITGQVHGTWWFIYSIIGMYFMTPFLANMFSALSAKQHRVLFCGISGYIVVCTVCALFGWQFAVTDFLFYGHWMQYLYGYFGYETGKQGISKRNKLLVYLGLMGSTAIYLLYDGIRIFSINMVVYCLFILLSNAESEENKNRTIKKKNVIDFLSAQSYSIYLIHAAVLSVCLSVYQNWGSFIHLKFFVLIICVAICSCSLSFLVDRFVVEKVQRVLKQRWF